MDLAYVLHEDGKAPRVVLDRHINAAFPQPTWLDAMSAAGFAASVEPLLLSTIPGDYSVVFVGLRPL